MVLVSSYGCIFCAILNNLSCGLKNVKYNLFDMQSLQWLLGAMDSGFLTHLRSRVLLLPCETFFFFL